MNITTSTQQISSLVSSKSPSFDDISKLFSLPLSDAATNLGVCTSVLKKICRDNGLVRWPYRQFLSGKSVEEIKKDAARERNKQLSDLSKAAGQTSGAPSMSTVSSLWFKCTGQSFTKVPFFGAVSPLTLAVAPFCITFAVVWAVYRNVSFAWIGQELKMYLRR